jgi:N-acetyl-anhydromuramyl-L-alanine amidase AmpD
MKPRFLTIHCAATPEGRDVKAKTVTEWDIAKFGQPSYHWVVELGGAAIRTLRDNQKGAHVGKANTDNIGICYVGGMDKKMAKPKDTRTREQKAAMSSLVQEYQRRFPGIVIRGHRDWPGVKKACPSFDAPAWIKAGMPID